ncbi:MAG: pilus assembly protein PilM [Elusimicrobia bacterium]|nr:pilus assembly protein PilM [Elusimicrobiota bacterium]
MSRLDALVDQVAFGRRPPAPSASLGVYLGPELLCVSECRRDKDGRLAVERVVRIPIPSDGKPAATTMSADFLSDPVRIADLARRPLEQVRWGVRRARVTLSHHLGLLRYFSMPAVDRRFLRSAVPIEAKKYIPIPFDALAYDFQTAPLPADASGRGRLGVLMAVTQSKSIAAIHRLLEALGLQADGLEVAPCSALRLWRAADPTRPAEPFAHVHMDGGNVRVMICSGGVPVFFREVFLGGDPAPSDQRRIDLAGCLSFVQKQFGLGKLSQVRVSGGGSDLERWRAAFAQEVGADAVLQDTAGLLGVKEGDWGVYASLGASAHSLFPAGVELDLAATDRVGEDERAAARDLMLAGAAAAVLLGATGAFQSAAAGYRTRELRRYEVDPQVAATLRGQTASGIDLLLRGMQAQLDILGAVSSAERPRLSRVLREVVAALPEEAWLERCSAADPIGGGRSPMTLSLRGRVRAQTVAAEQALAFQFKEKLLASPLGRSFEVQIAVRNAGGPEAAAAAAAAQGRTAFELELRAKR